MERCSVHVACVEEEQRFKWLESERAGYDLGEDAIRRWVKHHWWGYLRARWIEHLQGKRNWVELDDSDFGLLNRHFEGNKLLLDDILGRIKAGQENLDIIQWAIEFNINMEEVFEILHMLDINSIRLSHRFDS